MPRPSSSPSSVAYSAGLEFADRLKDSRSRSIPCPDLHKTLWALRWVRKGSCRRIDMARTSSNLLRMVFVAFLALALVVTGTAVIANSSAGSPSTSSPTTSDTRNVLISGSLTTQVQRSGDNLTFDLRGATSLAYPYVTLFPFTFSGSNDTVLGGRVIGQEPRSWTWDNFAANLNGHGTAYYMRGDGIVFDHTHARNTFDCIQPRPSAGSRSTYRVQGARCYYTRDDAIEADEAMVGVVRNSVFYPHMGLSLEQGGYIRVRNSKFIFLAMPDARASDGYGHSRMFKFPTVGRYKLRNDLICYHETPLGSTWKAWPTNAIFIDVTWVLGPGFSAHSRRSHSLSANFRRRVR